MMPQIEFRKVSTWDPEFVKAIRSHYTGSKGAPVGKKMAWEVIEDGKHRGWLGLGEPSYKLAARRRLGILDARPLLRTVSNFIYRLSRLEGAIRLGSGALGNARRPIRGQEPGTRGELSSRGVPVHRHDDRA